MMKWAKSNVDILFIFLVSLSFLGVQYTAGNFNMNDFQVYYRAGNRLLEGKPLFKVIADGHYVFKYSPTFAFFSIPLSILPLQVAKIVYWLILTTVFALILKKSSQYFVTKWNVSKSQQGLAIVTFIAMAMHFLREIDLGQVNLLLTCIYFYAGFLFYKGSKNASVLMLAATLFIKPFALIFIPLLIIEKEYNALLVYSIGVLFFFFIPMIVCGIPNLMSLQSQWIHELILELSNKKDLLLTGNHTIFSVLARYTPIRYFIQTESAQMVYKLLVLAMVGLSYWWFWAKQHREFLTNWVVLISWIPLLSYTSDNAFGSYLLFLVLLNLVLATKKFVILILPLFFIFLNPLELNRDVQWTHWVFDASLMGISAVIFMAKIYIDRYKNII